MRGIGNQIVDKPKATIKTAKEPRLKLQSRKFPKSSGQEGFEDWESFKVNSAIQ